MRSLPRLSNWVGRFLPIAQWLPRYERADLGADLLAGLAVWAVLVPQAVAYAALAGAPPEAGLFAALAAGVAYAVFGTCRQLDVGPSSTIAITAAAALATVAAKYPAQDYTTLLAALALLTGVVLIAAGLARLGFVSEFLARPVLVGFISGIGLVIIVGQIPKLLGLHGRERQRARDDLAHDRRARRDRLGDTGRRLHRAGGAARPPPGGAARSVGPRRHRGLRRAQPRLRLRGPRGRRDRRRARRPADADHSRGRARRDRRALERRRRAGARGARRVDRGRALARGAARLRDRREPGARRARRLERRRRPAPGVPRRCEPLPQRRRRRSRRADTPLGTVHRRPARRSRCCS